MFTHYIVCSNPRLATGSLEPGNKAGSANRYPHTRYGAREASCHQRNLAQISAHQDRLGNRCLKGHNACHTGVRAERTGESGRSWLCAESRRLVFRRPTTATIRSGSIRSHPIRPLVPRGQASRHHGPGLQTGRQMDIWTDLQDGGIECASRRPRVREQTLTLRPPEPGTWLASAWPAPPRAVPTSGLTSLAYCRAHTSLRQTHAPLMLNHQSAQHPVDRASIDSGSPTPTIRPTGLAELSQFALISSFASKSVTYHCHHRHRHRHRHRHPRHNCPMFFSHRSA
ncbi:unnamed protein product [Protopolystoma xenopodis]|uniref:Uncharacterized protein n=1 Tax=Protopolystoma xenopodis TaxID=117903 RepID=A0A3S4ZSJ7_9PLAT|nr:unnamed protein product [Protopolystoma xenopodis]